MTRARVDVGAAIEAEVIGTFVRGFDRRAAELRCDTRGDPAARSHRARTAALLEACAGDIQALMGPLAPAQGSLDLTGTPS